MNFSSSQSLSSFRWVSPRRQNLLSFIDFHSLRLMKEKRNVGLSGDGERFHHACFFCFA